MKSLELDRDMEFKKKLLWCFFWANRKAVRTEGCAPFRIEKIVTREAVYAPEGGELLKLSNGTLKDIEKDMEVEKLVEFKIKIGNENFDITFQDNLFSVSTTRNKEIEEEIIESLTEELRKGKPRVCSSFPQRVGMDRER